MASSTIDPVSEPAPDMLGENTFSNPCEGDWMNITSPHDDTIVYKFCLHPSRDIVSPNQPIRTPAHTHFKRADDGRRVNGHDLDPVHDHVSGPLNAQFSIGDYSSRCRSLFLTDPHWPNVKGPCWDVCPKHLQSIDLLCEYYQGKVRPFRWEKLPGEMEGRRLAHEKGANPSLEKILEDTPKRAGKPKGERIEKMPEVHMQRVPLEKREELVEPTPTMKPDLTFEQLMRGGDLTIALLPTHATNGKEKTEMDDGIGFDEYPGCAEQRSPPDPTAVW